MDNKTRCSWCLGHDIYVDYHDFEWGRPVHDDQLLFEMLILEGAQAGLSWLTILQKRAHYQVVFDQFDPQIVATYGPEKIAALLQDPGIVRNRLKVNAAVTNAKAFLKVQEEFGTFDKYIWQFVGGKPRINHFATREDVPVSTPESDAMSKDLKKRGFKFVGTTICYALMQSIGMVDDHSPDCWVRTEMQNK